MFRFSGLPILISCIFLIVGCTVEQENRTTIRTDSSNAADTNSEKIKRELNEAYEAAGKKIDDLENRLTNDSPEAREKNRKIISDLRREREAIGRELSRIGEGIESAAADAVGEIKDQIGKLDAEIDSVGRNPD